MATFTGNVNVSVSGTLASESLDLGTASRTLNKSYRQAFTSGTGANQANQMFADTRTVSGSSNDDLDLAGVLTDGLGNTITFTSIKAIIINSVTANGDALHITDDGVSGFISWLGATGDIVKLRPGGSFMITNPEANGYAVTAGTADILRIANQDAGAATYDITIIGEV